MDPPARRKNPNECLVDSLQKKSKSSSNEKSSKQKSKAICLRKDLWIEIIDFLDMKAYFGIIPLVNSFFYSLVKECRNYKTSLKIHLEIDYEPKVFDRCTISKENKRMEYALNCQLLKKLELKLKQYVIILFNKEEIILPFADYFIKMKSLKSIKILKVSSPQNFAQHLEKLLVIMENIEILKIKFHDDFPTGFSIIQDKYLKNVDGNQERKSLLKKISLKYSSIEKKAHVNTGEIFASLDESIGLEKFSLKLLKKSSINPEIVRFLKTNWNFKCLKLPCNFYFNKSSAEELCSYLASSEKLEDLQISDSIMVCSHQFFETLSKNTSLKTLTLKPNITNEKMKYKINDEDLIGLFMALAHSSIEEFSINFEFNDSYNFYEEKAPPGIVDKIEKFLESLDHFLSVSEKIRKININIYELPIVYASSLADLIIKHVKLGKIEFFAGYNLKMLLENKQEILELGKKDKFYMKNYTMQDVISEIFRKLLINTDSILKITEYKDSKNITLIEDFLQNVTTTKNLTLNPYIPKIGRSVFSPLHCHSLIVLSLRINGITELNLKQIQLESHTRLFSELLKEFISLEKLKLIFKNNNHCLYIFPRIIKTITTFLKNVSYLSCDFHKSFSNIFVDGFSSLRTYEPLKYLKFKNCKFAQNNNAIKCKLRKTISRLNLIILDLSNASLAYRHLSRLAKGLEKNQTILNLKLENITFQESVENINLVNRDVTKKIKAFLMILTALRSKKNYEKISFFYSFSRREKDFTSDESTEKYLECMNDILENNINLKEINVYMAHPDKFLMNYSEIILKAIKNKKELKIINYFHIDKMIQDSNEGIELICEYYKKICIWKVNSCGFNNIKVSFDFHQSMSFVISELIKSCHTNGVHRFLCKIHENATSCSCKILHLGRSSNDYDENSKICKFNLLDNFTLLEELILSYKQLNFTEIGIIEKNIANLKFLRTIKLNLNSYNISDLCAFLAPKNINCLKCYSLSLNTDNFESLSEKIKSSRLEKLTLKIAFIDSSQIITCFQQLIDAISCPSLKVMRIYMKYTQDLLDILVQKLEAFPSLEYLSISISENYSTFKGPIKNLISLFQNKNIVLSKVKLHKYVWDIEELYGKKDLKFSECSFNPADLIVLAELIEGRVLEKLKSVDLSRNSEMMNSCIIENIARIILALECDEIIVKNVGFNQNLVEEIKKLLGNERSCLVNFIIS